MKSTLSIQSYIAKAPNESKNALRELYSLVKKQIPNGEEDIRYGLPTIRLNGKNVLHFGAFKTHIALPDSSNDRRPRG